jgi:hypothetical protein
MGISIGAGADRHQHIINVARGGRRREAAAQNPGESAERLVTGRDPSSKRDRVSILYACLG